MTEQRRLILSHTKIQRFLVCRRKYQLNRTGWRELEKSDALIIGSAVHEALAIWHVSKDDILAFQAALKVIEKEGKGSPELTETVYSCLSTYYNYFRGDPLEFISTETDMTVEVNDWLSYRCKVDGIVDQESIHESKTSGDKPGNFWNKYDLDFQTTGNVWTARKKMDLPIKNAYVAAIFKPGYKNPVPKVERKKIEVSEYVINEWMKDLLGIAREIRRAQEEKDFFKSWVCRQNYGYCEYFDYCSNEDDVDILRSTHYLKVWDEKTEKVSE